MTIADTARRIWTEWRDWLARRRAARIERRRLSSIAPLRAEIAALAMQIEAARQRKRASRQMGNRHRALVNELLRRELSL